MIDQPDPELQQELEQTLEANFCLKFTKGSDLSPREQQAFELARSFLPAGRMAELRDKIRKGVIEVLK